MPLLGVDDLLGPHEHEIVAISGAGRGRHVGARQLDEPARVGIAGFLQQAVLHPAGIVTGTPLRTVGPRRDGVLLHHFRPHTERQEDVRRHVLRVIGTGAMTA